MRGQEVETGGPAPFVLAAEVRRGPGAGQSSAPPCQTTTLPKPGLQRRRPCFGQRLHLWPARLFRRIVVVVDRSFEIVVAWKRQETFRSLFFCICVCMVERSLNGRCSLALILLPFCGTGFPCSGCNFQVVRALLYFDLGSAIGNNAIVQGELSKIDQLPHDLVECRLAHPAIGRQPPDMVFDGAAFLVDPAKDHGVDAHVLRA